jgi:hypothetical protein
MLNYIQNSNKNAAIDTATEELEGYVYKIKTDTEVRWSVMTFGDIIDREKRIHKLAARVDSIEDFEEKLDQLLTK